MAKNYHLIMSKNNFVSEFGTLSLDMGRGVGKTSYILKHAKEQDLIVVHNQHYESDLHRSYPNLNIIHSLSQLIKLEFPMTSSRPIIDLKVSFPVIWIDEPSLCKYFNINDVEFTNFNQRVIKLGK